MILEGDDGPEITSARLADELGLTNPRSLANNYPKLKKAGVITVTSGNVKVTELGMKLANTEDLVSAAPENNEEHQERLMNKYKLKGGEKKVLLELKDGAEYDKEEIAEKLGMKIRSFSNNLTNPKKHGLLEVINKGKTLRLTDKMFLKKLGRPCEN